MTVDLPEPLLAYFQAREDQRTQAVNNVLAHLTERQQHLVRETAALGYEAGLQHPTGHDHPKDSAVVRDVIGDRLTPADELERRLIREAAVMGYVQGRRYTEPNPDDDWLLRLVVDACLTHHDLYPVLSGIQPCGECSHPGYSHKDSNDFDTPGTCLACTAQGAEAEHDYRTAEEPAA